MTYVPGDWKACCSMCAGEFLASELIKHWQGQYRCVECWEPRHPQDFVSSPPPEASPPWTQPPEREDDDTVFIGFCTIESSSGICDYGTADCSINERPNFNL